MLIFLIASTLASTPAQEPAQRVPALANAEACLRENVATAVAANDSALDAADFLLSYLCARPVTIAARYELNVETLAAVKNMSAGWPQMPNETGLTEDAEAEPDAFAAEFNPFREIEGVYVDTTSGEFVIAESASSGVMVNALRSQNGAVLQLLGDPKPVFLRDLAGRLVLEAQGR